MRMSRLPQTEFACAVSVDLIIGKSEFKFESSVIFNGEFYRITVLFPVYVPVVFQFVSCEKYVVIFEHYSNAVITNVVACRIKPAGLFCVVHEDAVAVDIRTAVNERSV